MEKKKTAVPAYLGVAAVWIGSHFGPGFATGAFSVRWYVKYGWIGLVTPLLAVHQCGAQPEEAGVRPGAQHPRLPPLCQVLLRREGRRCGSRAV